MRIDGISAAAESAARAAPKLRELRKASQDIEGVFVKDLLAIMRRSLPKGMLGDAPGKEIFEDMLDQALADSAAKTGTFGIGKLLYQQLSPAVLKGALAEALGKGGRPPR